MRVKTKILIACICVLLILGFLFRNLLTSLYFIGISHITSPDLAYVKAKMWSYDGGFKIGAGDFVHFERTELFQLRNDTIYYKGSPRAIVERLNKHFYQLTVKSIDSEEEGTYTNVEEM